METMENNNLEEMRAQLALLKEKLDKEEIVNDRLLRQSMKGTIHFILGQVWVSAIASVLVMVMMPAIALRYGLSNWLLGYTELSMAVCIFFTCYCHRGVRPDMLNGNLLDVAKRMRRLRQDYKNWKFVGYPMGGVWFVWMAKDILVSTAMDRTMAIALLTGVVVGGITGGLIGLKMEKKVEKQIDDMIKQIEE